MHAAVPDLDEDLDSYLLDCALLFPTVLDHERHAERTEGGTSSTNPASQRLFIPFSPRNDPPSEPKEPHLQVTVFGETHIHI